jgi:threonine dehydratase
VLTSRRVDAETGARVFFKCENFQRMGAFKFRGAFNALSRFDDAQRRAGVVTYSSGNHAQAIALAAGILGIPATIVMPHDAPEAKVAATLGYGATVVRYDRYTEDREEIGRALAAERGLTLVPPYDHPDVIAGQGTATLELLEEVGELDALYVCLGGGGLLSGAALAARAMAPSCRIVGVEPEAGDDGLRSLRSGRIVHIDTPVTIADGAQTQHLGVLPFEIIRRDVDEICTASDAELVAAMRVFAGRSSWSRPAASGSPRSAGGARTSRAGASACSSAAGTWTCSASRRWWRGRAARPAAVRPDAPWRASRVSP